MFRASGFLTLALMVCAGAQAASPVSTTMSVTASGSLSASGVTVTGPVTFTNGIPSGTFTSAAVSLSSITGSNVTVPFTITLSGSAGTLIGTITLPATLLLGGGSGTGSGAITGGTGTYAGATGSFPTLTGTGSISTTTGAISLSFSGSGSITVGSGGTTTATPSITAVLDAGGYTSNIAQGSIFVVKGSNLSASGYNASGFPLLTTYSNVSIAFTPTSGGSATNAYLVYTYNVSGVNQLAGVLPSTLAVGNYNVTVTNSGSTSAPFAVPVVKAKPGLITQDSSGSGLVVAQNYISQTQLDIDRFTTGTVSGLTISPAKPGGTVIAWSTGMGPVPGGDNTASAGYNFAANGVNVQVIVGGVSITPFYAGRAPGLAGADQIDFTLPSTIPTGCTVSFQISVNGVLSNPTFISIAPDANSSACVLPGFTTAQLQNFDQGGTYTVGGFDILNLSETVPQFGTQTFGSAGGGFTQFTGFQLASAASSTAVQYTSFTAGACTVYTITSTGTNTTTVTSSGATYLDAGVITLTGPASSGLTNVTLPESSNLYSLSIGNSSLIPGSVNGTIVGGTYTLNGAGGKDVGKFTAQVTLGSPLTVTGGLPSSVTRAAGMTVNWTGGNSSDLVELIGSSSNTSSTTEFICTATAGQGNIAVPASILTQLPATTTALTGFMEIASFPSPGAGNGQFTAPLTAGGTVTGVFAGLSASGAAVTWQ